MIDNEQILADLITDMKGVSAITDLLASASEIREAYFMGADFNYPAIRVRIDSHIPYNDAEPCDTSILIWTVMVLTEDASSLRNQQIGSEVRLAYHRKFFSGTGWKCPKFLVQNVPSPEPAGEKRWVNRIMFRGNVYPTTAS